MVLEGGAMHRSNSTGSRALASILVALATTAAQAQTQPGIAPASSDRPVGAPAAGRNSFIAPVVDIRIQDQGLALPKGMEEPPLAAPAPIPPAEPPKAEETIKTAPPATAK